jgi:dTDP-4-dehydrorhamnose reductase
MRTLIVGGTGLVGSALVRVLTGLGCDVVAPARSIYDILEGPIPAALLADVDVVVNAAVLKDPAERSAAWRVNVDFPNELARACYAARVNLIHISSDAVFSGRAGPSDEAAMPDPDDEYGAQKQAGEPQSALVIRTSVIGPERRGFNSLLCWFLSQENDVPSYVDSLWNGVTSLALARGIARVMGQDAIPTGVRHIFSEDVTKHDLLLRLAKTFERRLRVFPARSPIARDRRLRTIYPEFLTACAVPTLDEQLAELPLVADTRGAWQVVA